VNAVLIFPAGSPLWMFGGLLGRVDWTRQPQEGCASSALGSSSPGSVAIPPNHIFVLGKRSNQERVNGRFTRDV